MNGINEKIKYGFEERHDIRIYIELVTGADDFVTASP